MQPRILAALLCGCAITASAVALADTVVVNDRVQVRDSQLERPKRGITMGQVEKQFGTPVTRHPTVGNPPITRWDYNGFAVVFEHDKVIDSVVLADAAPASAQ
jgi:outer membrane protein assembly factor BamE (lipoprotein component of BamABCDE complex)